MKKKAALVLGLLTVLIFASSNLMADPNQQLEFCIEACYAIPGAGFWDDLGCVIDCHNLFSAL